MADLDESPRQDVLEESRDELVGGKTGDGVALGPEEDALVCEVEEALVGDADTVGVAAEVSKDLLRTGERLLGFWRGPSPGTGSPAGLRATGDRRGEAHHQ